jgi:phosphatidate cytidylyltransferase
MFAHLSPNVLWMLGGLFGLLAIASGVQWWLARRHPQRDFGELRARIRSWWVMVAVFALAIVVSPTVSVVFFGIVSFLALKEYFSIIPTRRADRRVLFWAYLAIPLQYYWVHIGWYGMFIIFIPVYLFLFLPFRMVLIGETRDFLRAAGTLHWGVMTLVFSISHAAMLLQLEGPVLPAGGAGLLLFLVFLTQANDIAQYIWGKRFGRRHIAPRVSPNKTWEGFAGGVTTTTLLALVLAPWLTPFSTAQAAAAGLLIGGAGFIGDVTISALKRDIGVKDAGSLLPGHGGVMDRIDSLTFTAPLFFHLVYYLYF